MDEEGGERGEGGEGGEGSGEGVHGDTDAVGEKMRFSSPHTQNVLCSVRSVGWEEYWNPLGS